jgi:hypothetical protein
MRASGIARNNARGLTKMRKITKQALAILAVAALAYCEMHRSRAELFTADCKSIEAYKVDLLKRDPRGQFVKLNHDQTIWARGFFVALPGQAPSGVVDLGTDDAFLWRFPNGNGLIFFSVKGVACNQMFIYNASLQALLGIGGI